MTDSNASFCSRDLDSWSYQASVHFPSHSVSVTMISVATDSGRCEPLK
jgi:hypothetical protein